VTISLVIPAYNEERLLPECLTSIHAAMPAFHEAGWEVELIVCDNNSTDRTADVAAAAGAIVVFEPVNQIGRARNTGAARATGDWLLFIDADSFPTRELCADVVAAVGDGRCLAGGSTVYATDTGRGVNALFRLWNTVSRLRKFAAGSFLFCEAAAFREIGGFSPLLYAGEEIELFTRLKRLARRSGRRIVILHRHPLRTSGRKARLYTGWEMFALWLRAVATGGRPLRTAKGSYIWYDGRR
jgi:glycosyltransferase involved in cell wall biosynthesis